MEGHRRQLLVAIDGTGGQTSGRTDTGSGGWEPIDFRRSFVKAIHDHSLIPGDNRVYKPGPDLLGSECSGIAREAIEFVQQKYAAQGGSPVILNLVGYSRGGYLAMNVARYFMGNANVVVNFLGLFDAVGRTDFSMGVSSDLIPGNVRVAYHALRDIRAGSRVWFGHSGLYAEAGPQYQSKKFWATHAAMGGLPWSGDEPDTIFKKDAARALNKESDTKASAEVWEWMSNAARAHGIIA
jgi:pimeloyl-ACP methyl ester carboxylesterase